MKIIEPSFSLHTPFGPLTEEDGVKLLRWIEYNARISHRSEEAQTEDSWKRFIKAVVLEHGDWSVVEHASVTAILRVDRGITHELVRHRLFSFTQESTRFVSGAKKYPEGLEFIYPQELGLTMNGAYHWYWENSVYTAEIDYLAMLERGVRPQEARSILPNALAATISITGNLRSWRWFFLARVTRESHPDMRRITVPMLYKFKKCIPILFDDIDSLQKQSISMGKVH